jgi:hypothetical protein
MIQVENISIDEAKQEVTVSAVIEDVVLTYAGSHYDPPEYGPALCTTTFSADCVNVNDEKELQKFLETVDYWEVIDDSDYYDDYPYS